MLRTKEAFTKGCLNGIKETSIQFDIENLLNQQDWQDQAATFREYKQYGTCFGPKVEHI